MPEALTLSVIPQNPGKRTPDNHDLITIRNHLYERWLGEHPKDLDKKGTFGLPLVMQKSTHLPFLAPHLVNSVLGAVDNCFISVSTSRGMSAGSKNGSKFNTHYYNLTPSGSRGQAAGRRIRGTIPNCQQSLSNPTINEHSIETTLDSRLQVILNRITKGYLARKKGLGVYNAAVLLVDTRDMGVKGLIGSADFFNAKIGGQINGTEIKRSPGSTLKPFIYGLALDQGLIHPNTVLKDVPHSFNGYNPENFDYDFMGPVKAKDALVLSRNIPAIYLSSLLKNPSLHQLLEQAQVSHLKSESFYGLSINLGGVELTMKELVGLYAMLVNDGVWYPIRFTSNETKHNGRRLLSTEASFLVLDMLKSTPGHAVPTNNPTQLPVAWKTGTSSGYRDAWAVGSFGPYVLAVWIGNFDNTANPAFIGKEIAAPLFFELINGIKQERSPLPVVDKNPALMNLKQVEVCKASGMLPTRYCTDTEWTWFIPGKSPIKTDTIFREVAINNLTGLRTCHINEQTRFEVFEFWPSDLLKIFKSAGIQRHTPPFFEADCTLTGNGGITPQITSPQAGVSYVVHANSKNNDKIPLSAVTDAGIAHLYWFINESFIGKTKPEEVFYWQAKPGKYVIRVVDDHGLSDARDITIQMDS